MVAICVDVQCLHFHCVVPENKMKIVKNESNKSYIGWNWQFPCNPHANPTVPLGYFWGESWIYFEGRCIYICIIVLIQYYVNVDKHCQNTYHY